MIEVDGLTQALRQDARGRRRSTSASSPGRSPASSGPNGAGKTTTLRSPARARPPDERERRRSLGRRLPRARRAAPTRRRRPRGDRRPSRALGAQPPARARRRRGDRRESRVDEVLELVELTRVAAKRAQGATRSGCGSGSGSPPRCSATPRCSSSTSRRTASTRRASAGCATSCGRSRPRPDRARVEPRALRGRADRRRGRDHPPRPACRARDDGRARRARSGRGTRVRSPEVGGCASVLAAAGIAVTPLEPDGLTADTSPERIGELAAANGIVLHELVAEAGSLEEVFLELTGGETVEVIARRPLRAAQAADDAHRRRPRARALCDLADRSRRRRWSRSDSLDRVRAGRPARVRRGFARPLRDPLRDPGHDRRVPARHRSRRPSSPTPHRERVLIAKLVAAAVGGPDARARCARARRRGRAPVAARHGRVDPVVRARAAARRARARRGVAIWGA